MDVLEWHEKFQKFNTNDLFTYFINWIENDAEKEFTEFQTKQWEKGENQEGQIIGYYKKLTEILSGGRKKEGEPYTLEDTGAFYKNLLIYASKESNNDLSIEIDDLDSKKDEIFETIKKYGNVEPESILGFNPKHQKEIVESLENLFIYYINKKILQ